MNRHRRRTIPPQSLVHDSAFERGEAYQARLPPGAVRETKKLLRRSSTDEILKAIAVESELFAQRLRSPEAMEAFQAFFQKRKPDFSKFA